MQVSFANFYGQKTTISLEEIVTSSHEALRAIIYPFKNYQFYIWQEASIIVQYQQLSCQRGVVEENYNESKSVNWKEVSPVPALSIDASELVDKYKTTSELLIPPFTAKPDTFYEIWVNVSLTSRPIFSTDTIIIQYK